MLEGQGEDGDDDDDDEKSGIDVKPMDGELHTLHMNCSY